MANYNRSKSKSTYKSVPAAVKSKEFGQNFFHNFRQAFELVDQYGLTKKDLVVEIGPGEGIFTKFLLQKVERVIAIEVDSVLFKKLQVKFTDQPNLTLVNEDFLKEVLPKGPYKVFSNLPFNISAAALRKILYATNSPEEAYLIVQNEVAEKLTGKDANTQAAMLYQPWFEFKIMRQLAKNDFHPIPAVDSVFLRITKRATPLLDRKSRVAYEDFVKYGFSRWKINLHQNYKKIFTYTQWERLSQDLGFNRKALPSELTVEQWVGIYNFYESIAASLQANK